MFENLENIGNMVVGVCNFDNDYDWYIGVINK